MDSHASEKLPNQWVLRAIGAWLDRESPDRFRILEVPDGMSVLLDRGPHAPQIQEVHWTFDQLIEEGDRMVRGRRPFAGDRHGEWRLLRRGRQDFLRALGFELDDAKAHGLLLDELTDGVLVTYSYLDPSQGYSWRKHMVVLDTAQMEQVIETAHARRMRIKKGFLSGLRGQQ